MSTDIIDLKTPCKLFELDVEVLKFGVLTLTGQP